MKRTLKKYFIPHEENDYHPHFLHTKRHLMYGGVFVAMKLLLVGFSVLVPQEVYVTEGVMAEEQRQLTRYTNELRAEQGLNTLDERTPLLISSADKAQHMSDFSYFAHVGPDGRNLKSFLLGANYDYQVGGENLAMGFASPREIVDAWIDSPTHYANLVDPKYRDIGISLRDGTFDGFPTIYVAQHFGVTRSPLPPPTIVEEAPPQLIAAAPVEAPTPEPIPVTETVEPVLGTQVETPPAPTPEPEPVTPAPVAADPIAPEPAPPVMNQLGSEVAWQDTPAGDTEIDVTANIVGDVDTATLYAGGTEIPLEKQEDGTFAAAATVPVSSDELFKVPLAPSIVMEHDGEITRSVVPWATVKVVKSSVLRQYTHARDSLGSITTLFDITKDVYVLFLIIFSAALLLKIFIEIHTQHVHVIMKTLSILVLLTGLVIW